MWHSGSASAGERPMALRLRSGQAPVRLPRFAVALAVLVSVPAGIALAGWRTPTVHASSVDTVTLAPGAAVHLATPTFLSVGKRYACTRPGGGPPEAFVVNSLSGAGR